MGRPRGPKLEVELARPGDPVCGRCRKPSKYRLIAIDYPVLGTQYLFFACVGCRAWALGRADEQRTVVARLARPYGENSQKSHTTCYGEARGVRARLASR
jgi:hypothetical protein